MHARRGKRYRRDVILYSMRIEEYLLNIRNKLLSGNYVFGTYKEFLVYEPKLRRILAAPFQDRIIHTWYVTELLERIFVPQFIDTSFACIKGRGVHRCVLEVKKRLYQANINFKSGYIIKMDVAKFFQNIDRSILMKIIERKVSDVAFLSFTQRLLNSSQEYDIQPGIGLPIGNFSSQLFGNMYLNEVDQYAKHVLKCKYYFRYLDDTCIICENKEIARDILFKLTCFYAEKLHLTLNKKTDIFPLKNGIKFCGYKIKIGKMQIQNKGKKRLVNKLKKIRYLIKNDQITVEEASKSICGHVGYLKCANVDSLVKKYFYLNE